MPKYSYTIPEFLNKQRLDKAIAELCGDLSRSQIQKIIKNQQLTVNNQIISDFSLKVKESDEIAFEVEEEAPEHIVPKQMDLDIVYEDDDVIVINKPIGLTVHPGAGNKNNTLVNGLLYHSKNLSDVGGEIRPGIVHRLDKDTSGLMVVAKNNQAHAHLSEQIKTRELQRRYKALIWGTMKPFEGSVDMPIGRCTRDRMKMTVTKTGREAITHYKTLEILHNGLFSLLECRLETGRTHQIRVHMSHNRHSIVGDQTYGNNARKIHGSPERLQAELQSFNHQALHSYYISFIHPTNGQILEFEREIEGSFGKLIEFLRIS
ncbi:MAG: hypothetical protein DGJ47_000684 [Rickettsiaceae bacterium]